MTPASRIAIVPLGLSTATFFVVTYVLCTLLGLLFSFFNGIHQLYPLFFPGFTWFTWPSFFIGLIWVFVYGWYIAVTFGVIYNYFARRAGSI